MDGSLHIGDAVLRSAVIIRVAWNAEFVRSVHKSFAQGVRRFDIGNREGAFTAAIGIVTGADAGFAAFEIGQNVSIAPARIALRGPCVEIRSVATGVDVAIYRAGAAHDLAAALQDRPVCCAP